MRLLCKKNNKKNAIHGFISNILDCTLCRYSYNSFSPGIPISFPIIIHIIYTSTIARDPHTSDMARAPKNPFRPTSRPLMHRARLGHAINCVLRLRYVCTRCTRSTYLAGPNKTFDGIVALCWKSRASLETFDPIREKRSIFGCAATLSS